MIATSSLPRTPKPGSVSTPTPFVNGPTPACCLLSAYPAVRDFTMSTPSSESHIKEVTLPQTRATTDSDSVTVEYPVTANATTSRDKSSSCDRNIPIIPSSKMSVLVSTGRGNSLRPFWNSRCAEESKKLWLPIETGSVVSRSNWSSGSWRRTDVGSWFSIREWRSHTTASSPTTSSPSSKFSIVERTAEGSTAKKPRKITEEAQKKRDEKAREREEKKEIAIARANRKKACRKERTIPENPKPEKAKANASHKIRLQPDTACREVLKKWFGAVRKTYNIALESIRDKKIDTFSEIWLKNRFVTSCNIPKRDSYLHETTPKHIREGAIKDLVQAYKTNWSKREKDPEHTFDVKFRSKKDGQQAIVIPSVAISLMKKAHALESLMKMYPTYLTGQINYFTRSHGGTIEYDCRLSLDKLGRFYLHIPFRRSVEVRENQTDGGNSKGWAALDPGIRSFLTGYSPDGRAFDIGNTDISRLYRLCLALDKLIGRTQQRRKFKRKGMLRAQVRARAKIRAIVDEVHWKTIRYLCTRYDDIVIPKFEVSQMVRRGSRRIRSKTARAMLTWSHYRFRCRLLEKASQFGCRVHVKTEEYTSKTCTACGNVKVDLGGAKSYRCANCGVKIDRDLNGARNIFLKNCMED